MNQDEKKVLSLSQRITSWVAQKIYYNVGKTNQRYWTVKRGEVYFVDLGQNIGSEENKLRPVVVIQSDAYNFRSPVFTCAIISSSTITMPDIQVPISGNYPYKDENGAPKSLQGAIDLGQIKTVAKERIRTRTICSLSQNEMDLVDVALMSVLSLRPLLTHKDNTINSQKGKIEYLQEKINELQKETAKQDEIIRGLQAKINVHEAN